MNDLDGVKGGLLLLAEGLIVVPATATGEVATVARGMVAAGAPKSALVEAGAAVRLAGGLVVVPATAAGEITAVPRGMVVGGAPKSALGQRVTPATAGAVSAPLALVGAALSLASAASVGRRRPRRTNTLIAAGTPLAVVHAGLRATQTA